MISLIDKIDIFISNFIHSKIKNKTLDKILARLNKGEIFFLIFLATCYYYISDWKTFGILFLHIGTVSVISEKSVLFIKKKISRERPLIRILHKDDPNPDMKHSFPSAHAANSMTVISLMVFIYSFSPYLLLFSLLAGLGRLFSLHHFLSDVIGGWLIGFFICILNVLIVRAVFP